MTHAWSWGAMFIPKLDDKSPANSYLSCSKVVVEGKRNLKDYDLNIVIDRSTKTIRIGQIQFPTMEEIVDADWLAEDGLISHITWYTTFKVLEDSSEYSWDLESLLRDKYYLWSIKSNKRYPEPIIGNYSPYIHREYSKWILDRISLKLKYYPRVAGWKNHESWTCKLIEDEKSYRKYLLRTYHSETEKSNRQFAERKEEKNQRAKQERIKKDQINREKIARKEKEKI